MTWDEPRAVRPKEGSARSVRTFTFMKVGPRRSGFVVPFRGVVRQDRAMRADIDHVVLWVEDPLRAVAFYQEVVGLEPLRVAELKAGAAPFPSVRLSPTTVLDLAPTKMAPMLNGVARKAGLTNDAAGHPTNHVCLAMSREELVSLKTRLQGAGVDTSFTLKDSFGARGVAKEAFYFADPDGNVLEARTYEP